MKEFGRLLTAMITPFDEEGKVDYTQAKKLINALLDSGSDGIVVSGTTGESPTLFPEERKRLFVEINSMVGSEVTVIANTGNNDTADSIELTKDAEKAGVDGCLLVVPYYNKPTQDGLFQHFRAIARETSLPCIIYNVPSRTITNLAAETVIKLSEIDNIVGIKEASADLNQIARIIQGTRDDFLVYSGNDNDTMSILTLGGYGVISVASHLVGLQIKQMMEDCVNGRIEDAEALHNKLVPLIDALFVVANPMPVKYALNYLGFKAGKPRLPLTEPDEKSRAVIEEALKNCKIDLPVPCG